jgi:hypothetical protein
MKLLLITLTIAAASMAYAVPSFMQQYNDYQQSSACIDGKVAQGVERANIIVIGSTCKVK